MSAISTTLRPATELSGAKFSTATLTTEETTVTKAAGVSDDVTTPGAYITDSHKTVPVPTTSNWVEAKRVTLPISATITGTTSPRTSSVVTQQMVVIETTTTGVSSSEGEVREKNTSKENTASQNPSVARKKQRFSDRTRNRRIQELLAEKRRQDLLLRRVGKK